MAKQPPQDDGILFPILYALLGSVGVFTLILIGGIVVTYIRGPSQVANLGTAPPAQAQTNTDVQSTGTSSGSDHNPEPVSVAAQEPQPQPEEEPPVELEPEAQPTTVMPEVVLNSDPEATSEPSPQPVPSEKPVAGNTTAAASTPVPQQTATSAPAPSTPNTSGSASNNTSNTSSASGEREWKSTFLGSTQSDKYHSGWCRAAKTILLENEIWFHSEEEAQTAGYKRCGICW